MAVAPSGACGWLLRRAPSPSRSSDGTGNGHWDVVLTQLVTGRSVLLATIPLDEWISLSATQYVLELHIEGQEVLKPTPCPGPR
jgi:hypothetical protein